VVLFCACSKPPPPPPPPQPTVQVFPAASNVLDTQVQVDVQVDQCTNVQSVTLFDHQVSLGSLSNAGARTTFVLHSTDIDYKDDGMAAALDLHATAVCINGQQGNSASAGMIFMPAQTVFPGAFNQTSFSIDPDGGSLVVCQTQNGQVQRLDTSANALQSTNVELGFQCSRSGYLVRGNPGELYWVEPNTAAARLNDDLSVVQNYAFPVSSLYLPPSNINIAVMTGSGSNASSMAWVDRTTGIISPQIAVDGIINGTPAYAQTGVVVPVYSEDTSNNFELGTETFNLTTEQKIADPVVLVTTPAGPLGTAIVPAMTLSSDGNRAYFVAGADSQQLYACASDRACTDPSQGGGLIFSRHLDVGPLTAAIPLGNYLLAIGPKVAQFVDLQDGVPQGSPLTPTGSLNFLTVLQGPGSSFYLLTGDSSGDVLELIILASVNQEAGRYHLDTGGFGFDVDPSGHGYVANGRLARLLLPSEYLQVRQ
jgi:hypothetical protein